MYEESQFIELKEKVTKDLKKEIVAFANSNDGTIYIGIKDDGTIIGVKNAKKDIEAISSIIHDNIKPDLTLNTKLYTEKINNLDIIVIKIYEGSNKPYYISEKGLKPSGVYIRLGNTSIQSTTESIKKLIIENDSDSFEEKTSLNQELHFKYLNEIFNKNNIELDNNKLKSLHIMNSDNLYTNLGLLLSDECPYEIKLAIFNGTNNFEFQNRKELSGSILKQINDTLDYFDLCNKLHSKIKDWIRIDNYDYPKVALREALLNAVTHRDFNYSGSILISVYIDHIEILSIGGLVKGITIKDIYNGVSQTRNPFLANIFYRLKLVESFGTGIKKICDSYKEYQDKSPLIISTNNSFKISLYNTNYKEELDIENIYGGCSIQEKTIIRYLKNNNFLNRSIAESILNLSKTRTNNILKNMMENEIIYKRNTGKNTYYQLKK